MVLCVYLVYGVVDVCILVVVWALTRWGVVCVRCLFGFNCYFDDLIVGVGVMMVCLVWMC